MNDEQCDVWSSHMQWMAVSLRGSEEAGSDDMMELSRAGELGIEHYNYCASTRKPAGVPNGGRAEVSRHSGCWATWKLELNLLGSLVGCLRSEASCSSGWSTRTCHCSSHLVRVAADAMGARLRPLPLVLLSGSVMQSSQLTASVRLEDGVAIGFCALFSVGVASKLPVSAL